MSINENEINKMTRKSQEAMQEAAVLAESYRHSVVEPFTCSLC